MSMQSEQINELMGALAKAQGAFSPAVKDSANSHFKTKYADLAAVWQACREPLCKNGLAVTQTMDFVGDKQALVTMLAHISGQWIKSVMIIPVQRPGPQELGSCLSYCRRYSLASMVGVYQDDDDAEAAQKNYRKEVENKQVASEPEKINNDQKAQISALMSKINDGNYVCQMNDYIENTLKVTSIYEISPKDFNKIIKTLEKKVSQLNEVSNGKESVAGVA